MKIIENFSGLCQASLMLAIKNACDNDSVVIVRNMTSEESFLRIANYLGVVMDTRNYGKVRTLKSSTTLNKSIGESPLAHPPHTDGVYYDEIVPYFMLQCVVTYHDSGGLGLFWDLKDLFGNMPKAYLDLLLRPIFSYSRLRSDGITVDSYHGPIIIRVDEKLGIRWRFDHQIQPKMDIGHPELNPMFQNALAWIVNYLQVSQPIRHIYQTGDVVICNNLEVLHGRTVIYSAERCFKRLWLRTLRA